MGAVAVLFVTWACLLVLLGIGVASATLLTPPWSLVVVGANALCMVLLILVLFMDLKATPGLSRIYGTGGILWLGFLITLTLMDYLHR